jgi:hypothetical protein
MILFDPAKHGPDLSAYLDGELDAHRAAEVERLLAESSEARVYLDELRAVAGGLRSLPRLSAPDALRAALRSRGATSAGAATRRGSWMIALRTGAIAAALGIAWIAGQSLIGPVTVPHSNVTRRDEPLTAMRETDEKLDKNLKDETTIALGIPVSTERERNKAPAASAAGDLAFSSAARAPSVAGTPPPAEPEAAAAGGESGRAGGLAGGPLADADDDLPAGEFDVVVNTRTPDEFKAVNDLLLSLQTPHAATNTAYVARVEESDGGEIHQLQLPAAEIGSLVAQLEGRSQQNVLVQRRGDAETEQAYKSAAAADEVTRLGAEAAGRPVGGDREGRDARRQLKKEAPPQRPVVRKPAVGSGGQAEGSARDSSAATAPAASTTGVVQADQRNAPDSKQRMTNQMNRSAGRGGRVVFRAPLQRQVGEQRAAADQDAASQPADADDTVVVNVLVAPPAAQSQPASRSYP